MIAKQISWVSLIAAVALACLCGAARAVDNSKDVAEGHGYFLRYCASCHGVDGTGNGPVARTLSTPPANLRLLADKFGMPLPTARLAQVIDGRDAIRAHGTHDMPVWGEQLYASGAGNKGEAGIGAVLAKIVAYLNSIQDRRTAGR
jgi:mono/diheme cytochrome c family protein